MAFDFSQTIGIYGFGVEGKSVFKWLKKHHAKKVFLFSDSGVVDSAGSEQEIFTLPLEKLVEMDTIIRSPGVHPSKILKYIGEKNAEKITSPTEIFLENSPTDSVIGVTGTKGKGTTSSLIAQILKDEFSGKNSEISKNIFLGGNIGTPVFDFFDDVQKNDIVVLELSSFQLYDLKKSPNIAVFLRTNVEHLDWHSNIEDYRDAKKNIFLHQQKGDVLIAFQKTDLAKQLVQNAPEISEKISIFSQNEEKFLEISHGKIQGTVFEKDEKPEILTSDICLRGDFHQENVLPAIAVVKQFRVSNASIKKSIQNFHGLPMRCELVGEKNGVQFFNDSFSTIPETSISALSVVQKNIFLILGGSEKNSNFSELAQACAESSSLKKVYLIGQTAERIAQDLQKVGFSHFQKCDDLESVFHNFSEISQSGDALILSPACASFGMFPNYKVRGERFNELVRDFLSVS